MLVQLSNIPLSEQELQLASMPFTVAKFHSCSHCLLLPTG
jgi:hypothetical protein